MDVLETTLILALEALLEQAVNQRAAMIAERGSVVRFRAELVRNVESEAGGFLVCDFGARALRYDVLVTFLVRHDATNLTLITLFVHQPPDEAVTMRTEMRLSEIRR